MKTVACFVTATLALACACFVSAEQPQYCPPGRVCNVTPGQSSYRQFTQPAAYRTSDGSYHSEGNHRTRVRVISVAQINPAYVASYGGDSAYDSTTQADILGEIRRLGARLDQLQQLVSRPPAGAPVTAPVTPPGAPAPTAPGPPGGARVPVTDGKAIGLSTMVAKCAACHMAGKLAPEQRFTLLDAKGNLVSLTDKQKVSVSQKTRLGMMPPPTNSLSIPPLTDGEFAAVADLIGF